MMAGLGPERPKVRIADVLWERGEEDTILQFLGHIPPEHLSRWDILNISLWGSPDSDVVQVGFLRGSHWRMVPINFSVLRDADPRVAQAIEQRARMLWEHDDCAIRGQLAPGEPVPLIHGWNE